MEEGEDTEEEEEEEKHRSTWPGETESSEGKVDRKSTRLNSSH